MIAAVSVVFPWSTWPIVPTLQWGLVLSKVFFSAKWRARVLETGANNLEEQSCGVYWNGPCLKTNRRAGKKIFRSLIIIYSKTLNSNALIIALSLFVQRLGFFNHHHIWLTIKSTISTNMSFYIFLSPRLLLSCWEHNIQEPTELQKDNAYYLIYHIIPNLYDARFVAIIFQVLILS